METTKHTSSWFSYTVATGLAIAFSAALLLLAWQDAVKNATHRFDFESASIKAAATQGFSAGHDIANHLATFLETIPAVEETRFRTFADSIRRGYPFIPQVAYFPSPLTQDEAACANSTRFYTGPDAGNEQTLDYCQDPSLRSAVATALEGTTVVAGKPTSTAAESDTFVLLRSLGLDPQSGRKGLIAVWINPGLMLRPYSAQPELDIQLYSESSGIAGRELLFSKPKSDPDAAKRWVITTLSDEIVTQFAQHSLKLLINRALGMDAIDHGLMLTALVLSLGTSLLLIALAHAKEAQARELQQRAVEIEKQVQRQTTELALARDRALEASRVKSEFLASMSHEIRTPLNAIVGMADLLAETKLSAIQRKYLEIFRRAGESLQNLVNDILDLSKIEAGQLQLEQLDFDLREVIEQCLDIQAVKADEKGIELLCQIAPDVPHSVRGDPSRLRQIILNLIGNAVKFTHEGEVLLKVARDPEKSTRIHVAVSDTGIGIPVDKLDAIFESFSQVDSSTTRRYGGTGLGLAISKRLVELMGGRISVASRPKRGSTFSFFVELEEGSPAHASARETPADISGLRILVVDDNSTNRLILREMLVARGAEVEEAADGPTAIEKFSMAHNSGHGFSLVLTDCQMPDMDGFEVAQAVESLGGQVNTVLMLTSVNLSSHLQHARSLGLGAYLVKPVKWTELTKAINHALARLPFERTFTEFPAAALRGKIDAETSILLVEDNADNRVLVNAFLKELPYRIDEAENGAEGVKKFTAGKYQIVLMDVQMPVMDGYAATAEIRTWERAHGLSPTPIIALTAHATREDVEKSIAAGCSSHLTKPIKKAVLLQALAQALQTH